MLTRDDLKVIAVATVGIALLGGIAAHELGNRPEVDHFSVFPSRGWHGSRFDLVVGFDGV